MTFDPKAHAGPDSYLTYAMEQRKDSDLRSGLRRIISHGNLLSPRLPSSLKRATSTEDLTSSAGSIGGGEGGESSTPRRTNPATNIHFIEGAPANLEDEPFPPSPRTTASSLLGAALKGHRRAKSPTLPKEFLNVPQHVIETANRPTSPLANVHFPSVLHLPGLGSSKSAEPVAPPPKLTFPPLAPRGPGLNVNKPSLPTAVSSTKVINGFVFSRDQIRRIKKLYTENKTEWTVARYIEDEYGVIISSNSIYELLKEEGMIPGYSKNVPGKQEELVTDFVEDLMYQTDIVLGFVVSKDIENRMIRLWDQGKRQVTTIRLFIQDEYGTKVPGEVVMECLKRNGRNALWDF